MRPNCVNKLHSDFKFENCSSQSEKSLKIELHGIPQDKYGANVIPLDGQVQTYA